MVKSGAPARRRLRPGGAEEDEVPEAEPMDTDPMGPEAPVLARARTLAHAIGESPPFLAFEAARKVLVADAELTRRLHRHQSRERELAPLRAQGGLDPREEEALEAERRSLWGVPVVRAFLSAQEEFEAFLAAVAQVVTEAAGLDYASACAPAGRCCS
jgi:cell fate (sporulation/competence/biofilm development) regulator YlbF (YheA/YmcA/DUF963 family)